MNLRITVGSVTNAQRGARILRANGLSPTISRLEKPEASDGCGFVISVYDKNDSAISILRKHSIRINGVERL